MKKRVQAIALLIAMVFSMCTAALVDVVDVKADTEVTINFHYLRTDGTYTDWDIWSWYDGGEGTALAFSTTADANGVIATTKVPSDVVKVGYIIRKGGDAWEAKDPTDSDNFLEIPKIVGGTVDVYVTSKDNTTNAGNVKEDTSKAIVIEGAMVSTANSEGKEADITFTDEVTSVSTSDFVIKDATGAEVKVSAAKLGTDKKSAALTLAAELDASKNYTIAYKGQSVAIQLPDYFSSSSFEKEFTYDGDDLGATWTKSKTTFKLWAPTATKVSVITYKSGEAKFDDVDETYPMVQGKQGVWTLDVKENLDGVYYLYEVEVNGAVNRAGDPYAKAVGINGAKSMVVDLDSTDPKGWDKDDNYTVKNVTDAILYELHVGDFSSDPNSGIKNSRKYLAFTEEGTKTASGFSTGIDYLKNLGVNFIHLLPTYDFGSVDESKDTGSYNWGYDPVNYFSVEGSYSTDVTDGAVRINEYKQMVQSLHNNDMGVVTDVVFNHVYQGGSFSFSKVVPGYFLRPDSNSSGCGNDVASERAMVKKYIVDCVKYWQEEYHIDGYRFDLMGILDVETMNAVSDALTESNPEVIIYGEGWGGMEETVPTKAVKLAVKANASMTERVAYFSDDIRNAVKGGVFQANEKGYASNATGKIADIVLGVQGAPSWAKNPTQVVNYGSAHDNNTLWDKMQLACSDDTEEDKVKMNLLSAAVVYMSQGIPFIMSGEEGLKTKYDEKTQKYIDNSYKSSDAINLLDYERADEYNEEYGVFDYYAGLIEFRKNHSALRMTTAEDVKDNLEIVNLQEAKTTNTLIYSIKQTNDEVADELYIIFNPTKESISVDLPDGEWKLCINGEKAGTDVIDTFKKTVDVDPISCFVLVKGETKMKESASSDNKLSGKDDVPITDENRKEKDSVDEAFLITLLAIIVAILAVISTFVYVTKNRSHISTLKAPENALDPTAENRLLKSIEEEEENKIGKRF